jgi:hypothetical protein
MKTENYRVKEYEYLANFDIIFNYFEIHFFETSLVKS